MTSNENQKRQSESLIECWRVRTFQSFSARIDKPERESVCAALSLTRSGEGTKGTHF